MNMTDKSCIQIGASGFTFKLFIPVWKKLSITKAEQKDTTQKNKESKREQTKLLGKKELKFCSIILEEEMNHKIENHNIPVMEHQYQGFSPRQMSYNQRKYDTTINKH